jgi:hypothetical protein
MGTSMQVVGGHGPVDASALLLTLLHHA